MILHNADVMERPQILLVNDGSVILQTMAGLMASKGFGTRVTDSAEEAWERLSTGVYHLVIMKLHGRQVDRLALLHMVEELCPGAKLIIITDQTPLPLDAYEVEADDYIIMPCRPSELWRRIFRCLKDVTDQPLPSPATETASGPGPQNLHRLGLMFHDVRGSVTSIDAGMKLLAKKSQGRLGDEFEGLLEATSKKITILISTTEEFLNTWFSTKTSLIKAEPNLDLNKDIVEPVLEELKDELLNHHIRVVNRLNGSSAPPSAQGNRMAIKSAFRNLLTNAINHGGEGSTIKIVMAKRDSKYQLKVCNTGATISPERQATLFSKPRLSAEKKREGKGLGLGLHLSREVVRDGGGDIHYAPGQDGSNFILTFPAG